MTEARAACCASNERRRLVPFAAKSSLPAVLLVLLPKCPACFAAYAAAWSGLTLSITTAAHVRLLLVVICVSSLSYLGWREAKQWVTHE